MADDEAKPPAALTETATRETRGYRVLVVEDEALIRLDIVETLEDAGYNVVGQAGDGEKAVELADELGPDLIVMDVKMPGMDGITAAERILGDRRCAVVMLVGAVLVRRCRRNA